MKLKYMCFCVKSIKHVRLPLKLYRITPGKDECFYSFHFLQSCGVRTRSFFTWKILIFKRAVCCEEQKNNGAHWVCVWRKVMWLMILCRTFRRQVNIPLLFPSLGVVTSGFPRQLSAKDREMRRTLVSRSLRTKGSHKKCLYSTLTAFHSVSQGTERSKCNLAKRRSLSWSSNRG